MSSRSNSASISPEFSAAKIPNHSCRAKLVDERSCECGKYQSVFEDVKYHHCIWLAVSAQVGVAEGGAQVDERIPLGWVQVVGKVPYQLLLPGLWDGGLPLLPSGDFGDA